MNQIGVWRRLRYSDLKEAACVRGGRYGISIDFGFEVVERLGTCGETFKSKFIDPTMEPQAHESPHRNERRRILQDCWSRISDAARFGHATVSVAKRLRSSPVLGNLGRKDF
jgi:hypothetical protein